MNTYRYTVSELPNIIVPLGVMGENEARQIVIDYSEWMTEGVTGYPEIKVLTPSGILYWAAAERGDEVGIEDGENTIAWTIRNVDTGESGNGLIRVILFGEDGERIKSAAARTYLAPEFDEAIDPPVATDIWEGWMDSMGERAAVTQENAYAASLDAAAAESYAIAIKENRLELIDGLMNLATAMAFSIALDEWQESDGVYTATKNNPIITDGTAATLHMDDENAARCEACIEMETGDGTITFTTDTLPTGAISGTLMLQGRFADSGISGLSVKTTVMLGANAWSENTQAVSVPGMTNDKTVIVSPIPADLNKYVLSFIRCISQGTDTLTFYATITPDADISVNILGL